MKNTKVPSYKVGRIYLLPLLLYFMLVLPILGFIALKGIPQFSKTSGFNINTNNKQEGDSLKPGSLQTPPSDTLQKTTAELNDTLNKEQVSKPDITFTYDLKPKEKRTMGLSSSLDYLFKILVLLTPLIGWLVNIPFKRYFRRKRKGKVVSPKLYRFCRKYILKTPLINSAIVLTAFTVVHIIMGYGLLFASGDMDATGKRILTNFLIISVVASFLTVLFIYFWQKHLVHIRYLEHIFTTEELQKSIFGNKSGKIRNRLYIASAMTTLFPLTIVMLYLVLSLTPVSEVKNPTHSEMRVMLGSIIDVVGVDSAFADPDDFSGLYYITAIDNAMMFFGIISGIFVAFVYILFFVNWSTQDIVKPVNELVNSMRKTGEGKPGHFTLVRTNDEVGLMSAGYNIMTAQLTQYIAHISRINEAYSRFVPRQFLEFLDKKDIIDIQLGDQVQKEMSVMFSDIRGFTELSESMTPKENFDFINHYLGYMEPVISDNNGFIDKFIGDAIMALFHEKPDDALNAAIQLRATLQRFNEDRKDLGKPAIDSGIGIHTGNLMLGVVGGAGRMDGTVISDAVNLASRLEGLTKVYQTSIIISEDTMIRLENPTDFNFRFIDIARVKGKKEAVYLFELIDGEPEEIKSLKISTKPLFGKGMDLYKNKQFEEARKVFSEIVELNPNDNVAHFYINRCRIILQKGFPEDWDGIVAFDIK